MPPEMIKAAPHDTKVDVWSLGITALEMALMEPPYFAERSLRAFHLIEHNPAPDVRKLLHGHGSFSEAFIDFVQSCLVKDRLQRPTMHDMLEHDALERCVDAGSARWCMLVPALLCCALCVQTPHLTVHWLWCVPCGIVPLCWV